jgi:hypothetical protein
VAQPSGGVLGVRLFASFNALTEPPAEVESMWLRAAWLEWQVEQTAVAGDVATSPAGVERSGLEAGAASNVVASATVESGG